MAVQLRKKALSNGKISLYLDLYNGEQRKYEFLKLYLYKRPKDVLEKDHNKEVQKTAENIRAKRELEMGAEENGVSPSTKIKANFLAYYEQYLNAYTKKDGRMMQGVFVHFKEFATDRGLISKDYLSAKSVNEGVCRDFLAYLESRDGLNGDTPYDYFVRFKKVLKHAVRDKIMTKNPAQDVTSKRSDKIVQKDVLTFEEVQLLAKAHCGNAEVKRAFLFACNTGLRFCDVKALKWSNIQGGTLKVQQQKTGHYVLINLNKSAQKLLGAVGKAEELVFTLPSHTGLLKVLRYWTVRAGITKKVTFHVARHSFATNLLIHGADLNTASSLLGHTSLTHTQKYTRIVESLKQNAVNQLPEIDL